MVFLTKYLFRINSSQLGKYLNLPFIDRLRVFVKSGNGGCGTPKLGGIGGDGGNVYIVAKNDLTLKQVYSKNMKKRYIANDGENSKKLKLFGEKGEDIEISVPCGITAIRADNNEYIGEVNNENERLLIAPGGKGGNKKQNAEEGKRMSIYLDLKLIADVGLIGFPNAGKSTFLSLVSRARPKIANYPFTTLNPQLGIIEYEDKRTITVGDMPGIIEGAHYNRGMGHKFLKHISRTKLNLFMIDINGFQLSEKFEKRSAFETLVFLNKELELYDSTLIDKPSLLVLNKIDSPNSNEMLDAFHKKYENFEKSLENIEEYWRPNIRVNFNSIIHVSVKENKNVDELCIKIREAIDNQYAKNKQQINENNKNQIK